MCAAVARHQRGEHRVGRVHQDHVGLVPGDELAGVVPQRRGPVAGGHPDHVRRLHQAGVHPLGPVHQRGELHHLERVPAVVALGGVVAQADVDAGGEHLRQPGDPVAELGVGARVVRDLGAGLAHQRDLGVGQPHAVRGHAVGAEQPGIVGHLGGAAAEPFPGVLHLGQRLVQVDVDAGAQLVGQRPGVAEQPGGGQRQPLDPDVHLDPPVPQAVHGVVGVLVVLQRVQVVLGQRHVVGQHGPDADVLRGPAQVRQPAVHVVDRSDPALDRLEVARRRRPVRGLGVQGPDERVPAGLQVLPQRQVVAEALGDRGVVVQVDQAGHDDLAGRVDDLVALARSPRERPLADLGDPVAVQHQVPAEVHLVGVVDGQHRAAGDDDSAHARAPMCAFSRVEAGKVSSRWPRRCAAGPRWPGPGRSARPRSAVPGRA